MPSEHFIFDLIKVRRILKTSNGSWGSKFKHAISDKTGFLKSFSGEQRKKDKSAEFVDTRKGVFWNSVLVDSFM